jgi:thiosulfate/3-mercaptopyruvate sulfurtransferase
VIAARLVWMLRATGHDAALLDGGISAYGGELERGPGGRAPAAFTPRPFPPELLAELDEAAHPRHETVIDARQPERYRGEEEPLDPRAGHIPGALSIPCRANLDERLRFLPVEALRARFSEAGIADAAEVISYCGSGITACHNLLAMEHAGLGRGRLFPGSWSQYSRDQRRPVATGAQPGEPQ